MTTRKRKRKDPATVALRRKGAKVSSKRRRAHVSLGKLAQTMQKLPRQLRSRKGGRA